MHSADLGSSGIKLTSFIAQEAPVSLLDKIIMHMSNYTKRYAL